MSQGDYRLALDINTSAIGLVTYLLKNEQPDNLAHIDVQVFGEPLADAKTGKLKKLQRREKRLMRRQVQRRAQRLKKIAHLFSLVGVTSEKVYEVQKQQTHGTVHKWRATAATEKIELPQLMAVLLVMAKNRGYEGRFTKAEDGKVLGYINEVENLMKEHNCDTLGQLLYTLKNDASNHESMRAWNKISETGTYAHRDMLKEEFETIWKKQKEYHDILNRSSKDDERINHVYTYYFKPDTVKSIIPRNNEDEPVSLYDVYYMAMFDQRPIWWDTETIGCCELEPKCRRASRAHPVFQTYRIEQLLNDLKLKKRTKLYLSKEEKEKIRLLFDMQKEVSASRLYKELGIENDRFTHDRSKVAGEKEHKFMGNKTNCVLNSLEKDVDMILNEKERELFIEIIADIDEPSVFAYGDWYERKEILGYFEGVDEKSKNNVIAFINKLSKKEKIQTLKQMGLDTGRADYSVEALTKLLPHMKEGKRPDEARDIMYPEWNEIRHDNLSHVGDSVVQQALHETKKAIDYAIKKHGGQLPTQVVVELSREMKLSQEKRGIIEGVQKNQKKARDQAWEEIEKEGQTANENLCKKYILWQEQGMECAYCGKYLGLDELCTNTEIDHIVPKNYGGQSNHANLAVVCQKCNQQKSGKLPLEAFGGTKRENVIRTMSEKMKKPTYLTKPFNAYSKDVKRRAEILLIENKDDLEGDFNLRQNSETAWIGRELTAYLKQLCNISTTEQGSLEDRVYVTRGRLTAYLRRRLGLNTLVADIRKQEGKPVFNRKKEVMEDGGEDVCGSWHETFADRDKDYDKRSDHRHHAVDAAVIGLVDRRNFKKATNYYKSNHRVAKNGKTYPTLDGFEKDIPLQEDLRPMLKKRLHNYIVWHKHDRNPIDGFFDENIYRCEADTNKLIKRKNLSELVGDTLESTKKNLDLIVGENVKQHIIAQFKERYSKSEEKSERDRCKNALCGTTADDGIFYPVGTKNKVKHIRVYHKVSKGVGTYNKDYDKRIVVHDARNHIHTHVLRSVGYTCFEIIKDTKENLTYKPVPYHVYWTKEYQTRLKTDDGIVRIYKNDMLYDRESEEYYVVKQLHTSSGTLKCIKTTESMTYGDAIKKAKQLTKDFGKGKIKDIQVIKSRKDMVDTMNTHESPSDHST